MTDTAAPAIRPAATILLLRDEPAFEVLMVKRHHQIDFASGALVFPGGKAHAGDHDPRWSGWCVGWDDIAADQRPLRIAAIREAYEEAAIIMGRHKDGAPFAGCDRAGDLREAIAADQHPFLDLIQELDIKLDLAALTVFARWITPPLMSKRFDTWFYVATATGEQLAACDERETVDAEWMAPAEALRLAASGERKVLFPTRMNLQLLAESASAEEASRRAAARKLVTVEPMLHDRPGGGVLVIQPDAGYGAVEEPLSAII